MDSTGLRSLLEADSLARQDAHPEGVAFVRGPAAVERLLAMTGIGDRLTRLDAPPGDPGLSS
jgi:hypothetical protein